MSRGVFIGRSTVDIVSVVDRYPEADEKITAREIYVGGGGPALNSSITFSFLGGTSTLLSSIGSRSNFSLEVLVRDLKENRVRFHDICGDEPYQAPISTVISSSDIATRMVVNSPTAECSSYRRFDWSSVADADIVLLDQHESEFVRKHSDDIRHVRAPIVLDGGGWKDWSLDFLRLSTIPIVSQRFFDGTVAEFGAMCESFSIQQWAITRGSSEIIYHDGGETSEIAVERVATVDTLGAGDIFHGAFCYYFVQTSNFALSLRRAARVAGESCKYVGTRKWMQFWKS